MNSAARAVSQWKEVTERCPCAICGKTSWCSFNWDGSSRICRRVDDGTGEHRVDRGGQDYWIYRQGGLIPRLAPSARSMPPPPEPKCAAAPILHRAYSELLSRLVLEDPHIDALRARALPDHEIAAREYRSYPLERRDFIADSIARELGEAACATVPGFYRERIRGREYWKLAGPPGLLIPVRSHVGTIVALKVRIDQPGPGGAKYLYLSSKKRGGPGPGAPVHVPLGVGPAPIVRITEGELKADIATALSGLGTISIPGVSAWRSALPTLRWIGARRVRLAFDADASSNPVVARALIHTARALESEHYQLEVETWNPLKAK